MKTSEMPVSMSHLKLFTCASIRLGNSTRGFLYLEKYFFGRITTFCIVDSVLGKQQSRTKTKEKQTKNVLFSYFFSLLINLRRITLKLRLFYKPYNKRDCIRYSINESRVAYSFLNYLSNIIWGFFLFASTHLYPYGCLKAELSELCNFCPCILKSPGGYKLHSKIFFPLPMIRICLEHL